MYKYLPVNVVPATLLTTKINPRSLNRRKKKKKKKKKKKIFYFY